MWFLKTVKNSTAKSSNLNAKKANYNVGVKTKMLTVKSNILNMVT